MSDELCYTVKDTPPPILYRVLWTGGWDSSYRMVQLSFLDVEVEPVYILDPSRKSADYELSAMDNILKSLQSKEKTKATFLPVRKIPVSDLPVNDEITSAWKKFSDEMNLGVQHEWTARLATIYPGIEMCIEYAMGDYFPIRSAITKYGKLFKTSEGLVIDPENSSRELQLVIGNIVFPILDIKEQEMLSNIREWGYEDVMSHIWFCHNPIHGKPCGMCIPCCTKLDSGMDFLLSSGGKRRHKTLTRIIERHGDKTFAGRFRHLHYLLKI